MDNVIDKEFELMLSMARTYFDTAPKKQYNHHQLLVLSNDSQRLSYPLYSDNVEGIVEQGHQLISRLKREGFSSITKIACMWEGYSVDTPSHEFMKGLCELDPKNRQTQILLKGFSGKYNAKKISDIIG